MTTIIIGAGMAGLACARRLADAGEAVIVLDKGRGLGGRLATRRGDAGVFDHGAQYVTARAPAFQTFLDQARTSGAAGLWPRRDDDEAWWVGEPGMSGLVAPLAEGLDIRRSHRVSALRKFEAGWLIDVDQPTSGQISADRVVLAIPAPQARTLLAGHADFAAPLDAVVYAPCWTLMLTVSETLGVAPDVHRSSDGPCAWLARNTSKPGRPSGQEAWVMQAGPRWSEIHLEEDAAAVTERLCDAFRDWAGVPVTILHAAVHRWRYARVMEALGEPFLWDKDQDLGLAGDWCLGPRVEAAFLSGHRLAGSMLGHQTP
ncbi:NAD(P)/FAD-dependent oxidoreductase [Maricaulis maris]|uniref:NAD(P)/FAD-dependent oxidoreductase n=1 Tax=Maricaulis maris TaxID=74318 RepID=UPI0029222AA9|nr:hypothetical protein MACH15_22830 [Maricaulis maris]